jgi:hypothetical protein
MSNKQQISSIFKEMKDNNHYDFRIWKQRRNISSDYIHAKISKNSESIKQNTALLNGDKQTYLHSKKKNKRKHINTNFTRSSSTSNIDMISPTVRKILSLANTNITEMKSKTEQIMKKNGIYLEHFLNKNKTYCQKASDKPSDTNDNNSLPPIENTNKLIRNFDYINDNFRRQLNKAFLLYNPYIHLENLYFLQHADPSIKEDINRVRNNVNEDVKEITDKRYYLKRYKELVNKNKQLNKTNSEVSEDKNTNTNRYMGFHSKFMNPADVKRRFPKKELRTKERK